MTQMRAVDAAFLAMEQPNEPMHIGSLMIFGPSTDGPLTLAELRRLVESRLPAMASARRVVVPVNGGLSRPRWRSVKRVDLDAHLGHVALASGPADRGEAELGEVVAAAHARHLDRRRPLWELLVIDGLPEDHVAVYAKVHMAAVDDTTGVDLMTNLLDADPRGRATMEEPTVLAEPDPGPGVLDRLFGSTPDEMRRAMGFPLRLANRAARSTREQLPGLIETGAEMARRMRGMESVARLLPTFPSIDDDAEHPTGRAPRLSFNAPIGPERRYAIGVLDVADVARVRERAGGGFHDVVLAAVAGGLRRWLLANDELPTSPIVALLPMLVDRPRSGPDVSSLVVALPTNVADPRRRLELTRSAFADALRTHVALPASLEQDVAMFAPPAVATIVSRLSSQSPLRAFLSPTVNLGLTNVPGPRHHVTLAGRPLVSSHPVLSVSDRTPLHIGVQRSPDVVGIGVIADRDHVDDLSGIVHGAAIELSELPAAYRPSRTRKRPR